VGLMPDPSLASPAEPRQWPLLAQFDYLSTVSGGGYTGGFFSSLFVNGRLTGAALSGHPESDPDTVRTAYSALQDDPPSRIHRDTHYQPRHPGAAALAWLRDNGRYLAPTGTGDLLYGLAVTLRNWFATHYVVATLLTMLMALTQSARWLLAWASPFYADIELQMLHHGPVIGGVHIWPSPLGLGALACAFLALLPLGVAFWYSHPGVAHPALQRLMWGERWANGRPDDARIYLNRPPVAFNLASFLGLCVSVMLGGLAWLLPPSDHGLRPPLLAAAAMPFLACLYFARSAWCTQGETVAAQRVHLTRSLTHSLTTVLALGAATLIATLGQTLWLRMLTLGEQQVAIAPLVVGGAVWGIRWAVKNLSDTKGLPSWLSKVPLSMLAGVAGALLWLTVAVGLELLLLGILWPTEAAALRAFAPDLVPAPDSAFGAHTFAAALAAHALLSFGVLLVLVLIVGRFPGYLNLSTFQSLYSARITRAYLGATNFLRFAPPDVLRASGVPTDQAEAFTLKARDVAEPMRGDSLDLGEVHANRLAPIHLVNVCLNQSVSPGEQLVQRDRKGRPLTLAPGGFYLDGKPYPMPQAHPGSELSGALSFGEWLGVSGAAFSTGLGRQTGLGMSLALGFANVRLGRWWQGLPPNAAMQRRLDEHPIQSLISRTFPTQAYLLDELRGQFYGDHRRYQYLSDGGHFDNTGVFELLRPAHARAVQLIVLTDCGADPLYQFEDLANLIRLVRIDHGLEIVLNPQAGLPPPLASASAASEGGQPGLGLHEVFGRPKDFAPGKPRSGRCALLLDVVQPAQQKDLAHSDADERTDQVVARIVLLKPTLLAEASIDIAQYQATHTAFPQETTIDQFFDEAQWESYRKLGVLTAQRVFQGDGSEAYRQALWRALLG
jgi:hypothetical protein